MRVIFATVAMLSLAAGPSRAQTFQETVHFIFDNDAKILDANDCVIERHTAGRVDIVKLNDLDPSNITTERTVEKFAGRFETMTTLRIPNGSGPRVSIFTQEPERMMKALTYLYSKYCTGKKRAF